MAFSHVITNTVAVISAAGYVPADKRRPIEEQSEQGMDRCFQVEATPVAQVLALHGISRNVRNAELRVKVGFFAGGGDAGGEEHGGDLRHVDARAFEQIAAIGKRLENTTRYGGVDTGIRRQILRSWKEAWAGSRSVGWELLMDVEWEEAQNPRAVTT